MSVGHLTWAKYTKFNCVDEKVVQTLRYFKIRGNSSILTTKGGGEQILIVSYQRGHNSLK